MRLTTRTNLAMRTLMFCAVNPGVTVRKQQVAEVGRLGHRLDESRHVVEQRRPLASATMRPLFNPQSTACPVHHP